MKKYLYLPLLAAMVAFNGNAQQAQRLEATKANEYALAYSLPKTMIDVTLEAEITVKKPGEFYKYAPKYLNISDPITKESHSVRLLSAKISTHGIANASETYTVQFKSGQAVYVALNEAGIPLAINTEEVAAQKSVNLPVAVAATPTPLETAAAKQVISEEMLQCQSTAKRAELAAQYIFTIRQNRSELIAGQAESMPPDGKSLQLMLDNLQAQEDALMAMFVGTTSTYTQVATFVINPDELKEADTAKLTVARLSTIDGIVDSTDLSGSPVYLNLSVVSRATMPVNDKDQEIPFPKNGIPYRIPGQLQATVTYDGKQYANDKLDIAQLGIVYGLQPNSFTDKKSPIYILYSPSTGAILRQGAASPN
jgi:hypothetical protein